MVGLVRHHLGRVQLLRGSYADALRDLTVVRVLCDGAEEARLFDTEGPLERLAVAHLRRADGRGAEAIREDVPRELRPHVRAFLH